jgi:type IV secretion system protein VirB1
MMPSFDIMHQCAPNVAPETIAAIIRVESGGNAFALGVNGPVNRLARPQNAPEAIRQARYYMSLGYSVDLGLMQINSNNLAGLGYSVEEILDPCNNLRAGSRILSRGYAGAVKRYGQGQDALKAALSAYNTGNYERGFQNGYVAKYYAPGIRVMVTTPASTKDLKTAQLPVSEKPDIFHADSTVYSLYEEEEKSSDSSDPL